METKVFRQIRLGHWPKKEQSNSVFAKFAEIYKAGMLKSAFFATAR
jgi:hypothetical protein